MTKVYGASDDLIEFEGDFRGEAGASASDKDGGGDLVVMSDGTILEVKYGKGREGIWEIKLLRRGTLFASLHICTEEKDGLYSDVAHFEEGIKWAYVARKWESVQ